MGAEIYQIISIAAFSCGGILTLTAIVLFLLFDIPALIGELSGRTAEKQVRRIREQNRQAAEMRQKRPKRTALLEEPRVIFPRNVVEEETVLLGERENQEEGTVLLGERDKQEEGTVLLGERGNEAAETLVPGDADAQKRRDFYIIQDVLEVHTEEVIQDRKRKDGWNGKERTR